METHAAPSSATPAVALEAALSRLEQAAARAAARTKAARALEAAATDALDSLERALAHG